MKDFLNKYKKILTFLTLFFVILFYSNTANAAIVSINTEKSVSLGQRISVDILVDPEDTNINSIESTLFFSNEYLDFNGFSVKQSSIPIWVEEPKEVQKGSIHFAGVVPGGLERLYDPLNTENKSIPIIRLFFITKKVGNTSFTFGESQVLKNDGKGTKVPITLSSSEVKIIGEALKEDTKTVLESDTNPPLPFEIAIVDRSKFGKTPRQAVFASEDGEGGIQRYEASVGNLDFFNVKSPFSLPYRLFPYNLTIRAYDFSGNFRDQQITVRGDSVSSIAIFALVLLGFVGILKYLFNKKRKYENPS